MPEPRTPPAPLPRRILQVFVAPRELFQGFREHAPWIGPLLVTLAVQILLIAALPDEAFRETIEGAVTRRGEPVTITSSLETVAYYGRILGMLSAFVYVPMLAIIAAAVLTFLFSTLLRGEGRYVQYLAVATHASLILALGGVVALGVAALRGTEIQAVTPALLFPPDAGGLLVRALSGIDLFTVWALVVTGLGVSMVNRQRSWAGAAGILVGIYLFLAVALSLLGG